VSLEAVVNDELFVAKNTLSFTPDARNSTVAFPVYTSPDPTLDFLAVEQALNISVDSAISNKLVSFLFNFIFSPQV